MTDKPELKVVESKVQDLSEPIAPVPIPPEVNLDRFKSKEAPVAVVETLLAALPHYPITQAKDFVRLHPNEQTHWSDSMCFVTIPIKGQARDTLHMIDSDLANLVPAKRIQRFRLALATMPYDIFFLAHVPVPTNANFDNTWIQSHLDACERAKTFWLIAVSQKAVGRELYEIQKTKALKPYPEPRWPVQSLNELIDVTFKGRMITKEADPAFARLIGDIPSTT
jgi:hypothetical protein